VVFFVGFFVRRGGADLVCEIGTLQEILRQQKMANPRHPRETYASTTRIVMPNDTNTLGNLTGGNLLNWMDETAAISAMRHSRRVCVTAAVNNVSFQRPIALADVVTVHAEVSRAFRSSMEVYLRVSVENPVNGESCICNEAMYTFVAVDQFNAPIQIPEIHPESPEEQERFDGALRRRQLRLILAGKLKPADATELKALFN
jgi:acyl-CoA hydrolase